MQHAAHEATENQAKEAEQNRKNNDRGYRGDGPFDHEYDHR